MIWWQRFEVQPQVAAINRGCQWFPIFWINSKGERVSLQYAGALIMEYLAAEVLKFAPALIELLVMTDLTKSNGTGTIPMKFLDSSGGWCKFAARRPGSYPVTHNWQCKSCTPIKPTKPARAHATTPERLKRLRALVCIKACPKLLQPLVLL